MASRLQNTSRFGAVILPLILSGVPARATPFGTAVQPAPADMVARPNHRNMPGEAAPSTVAALPARDGTVTQAGRSSMVARAAPGIPATPAPVVADIHGPDAPGAWDYASVDADAGQLYVARMTGVGTVALAGDHTGPELAAGRHVHAVLPLPGHRLLFTNGDIDTATVIDARSGRILATLKTGAKPDGAVFDPVSNQALIMNGKDGTITRIAIGPGAPRVIGTITVGGALEAPALGGSGRLFVNIEDRNEIAVVSLASGKLTALYPLAGCEGPTGLSFDPVHRLLVSACANGVAKVLREDGTDMASLSIGPHPDAVIADPAHDRMFIPSGGNGTLSEISLVWTPHVTRVMTTRKGARTGAYDPRTERVYLPYGQVVRTAGQPPALVPGSFGILVVDVR